MARVKRKLKQFAVKKRRPAVSASQQPLLTRARARIEQLKEERRERQRVRSREIGYGRRASTAIGQAEGTSRTGLGSAQGGQNGAKGKQTQSEDGDWAMAAQSFAVGERVLCYHGQLIYEAKVLKAEVWDERKTQSGMTGAHLYVHYKGWKQTWDEWAHVTRLLKFNQTNIALQKALQSQYKAAQAASASSSKAAKATAAKDRSAVDRGLGRKDGARSTKRGREEDEGTRKPEMKLNVPEPLKVLLVDDWEAVTKNNQLIGLPRKPNVVELLEEFKQYVLSQASSTQLKDPKVLLPTIIAGLQTYFDRALGANLLYRFERPQYAEARKRYVNGPTVQVGQEKETSAIYGAEHFLRMLVSLPQMVASSSMDGESVGLLRDYANELLQWMVKERHRIFVPEYEGASIASQ